MLGTIAQVEDHLPGDGEIVNGRREWLREVLAPVDFDTRLNRDVTDVFDHDAAFRRDPRHLDCVAELQLVARVSEPQLVAAAYPVAKAVECHGTALTPVVIQRLLDHHDRQDGLLHLHPVDQHEMRVADGCHRLYTLAKPRQILHDLVGERTRGAFTQSSHCDLLSPNALGLSERHYLLLYHNFYKKLIVTDLSLATSRSTHRYAPIYSLQ